LFLCCGFPPVPTLGTESGIVCVCAGLVSQAHISPLAWQRADAW
jgi:hypothetical protein